MIYYLYATFTRFTVEGRKAPSSYKKCIHRPPLAAQEVKRKCFWPLFRQYNKNFFTILDCDISKRGTLQKKKKKKFSGPPTQCKKSNNLKNYI